MPQMQTPQLHPKQSESVRQGGTLTHTLHFCLFLLDTIWTETMANYTVVDFDEKKITLSFTQEQLKVFFGGDDEDNSEEAKTIYREEIDEAWRMRSVEKELEAKRYSYFRKVISEELREREAERRAERKRSIQEALEQMANEVHNYPDSTEEVPLTFTIKEIMELFESNDGDEREDDHEGEHIDEEEQRRRR